MWRVYGGALAVIAGIAAFIEAHSHRPLYAVKPLESELDARDKIAEAYERTLGKGHPPTEPPRELLSGHIGQTPYDLLVIGAWALVILGGLTVALWLIRYWRAWALGIGRLRHLLQKTQHVGFIRHRDL
jgi:hypothetical protein